MTARDASAEAYHEYAVDFESGQLERMDTWFSHHGPASRAMAGKALGFPANVYSARANKLLKAKDNGDPGRLVDLSEKRKCEVTGVTVSWLVHISRVLPGHIGLQQCDDCQRNTGVYDHRKECCEARFIANWSGDPELCITTACTRHGHDNTRIRLALAATRNWLRARHMAAAANEAMQ